MLLDKKVLAKIALLEKTYDALRYIDVVPVQVEIAETFEHLHGSPDENGNLEWRAAQSGEMWGDNWSSAWFRGDVRIPESFEGIAFIRANTGGNECQFLVDGKYQGVFDVNHPVRVLDLNPSAGKTYSMHFEAYAGHGFPGTQPFDTDITVGNNAPPGGGMTISAKCCSFGGIKLVAERADVSEFVYALKTLRQLASALDENSLRRGRIQACFGEVFKLVSAKPAEFDEAEWRAMLQTALSVMKPLLDQKNGPTAPFFGIIGHSHIDTAWLWTIAETKRKIARTFSSVLALMDQYPEFRFTQSAAYHSAIIQELHPDLFERIAQRVREGRWEINGAMWIEPDCNIPSGESLVRQCLVGQTSTRAMFGVTSDTLWQPDVFGYSAALPQILQKCDVSYFCTTKMAWNDTNHFPYDTFNWRGIDGTSVLSHFNLIDCTPDPEQLTKAWNYIQHKDVQDRRLMTFGYGDGGGGPTAEMIEMGRLTADLEGCPKTRYMSVTEFMDGVRDELHDLPTWSGELYLELHRGTLTSVSPIKRYNRLCEIALRGAELTSTVASLTKGITYPSAELLGLWKRLLINQFHDILPGSSIAEVNIEAIAEFIRIYHEIVDLRTGRLLKLAGSSGSKQALLIVNDLSWTRAGELSIAGIPAGVAPVVATSYQNVEDVNGEAFTLVHGIDLVPLGTTSLELTERNGTNRSAFTVVGSYIETPTARVRMNAAGQIVSFYGKSSRRELVAAGKAFNVLLLGEDVPAAWDNWDIDRDQRQKMVEQSELVSRKVVADGPLQLRIRQEYKIGRHSTLTQDIVFHSSTARVDFDTVVDWREKYQLLKVSFSPDIVTDSARHEIQFGHLSRTTHDNSSFDRAQFDVCAHKWTDISETGYGIAFLNDSKYACTVKNGDYVLSLLKSGRHPDARGDEGRHRFRYAILPHNGGFSVESVIRPAYEFNSPVISAIAPGHDETNFSLASVDAPSVIVEAVKWAEDGSGFVLRLYESSKTATHAIVKFGVPLKSVEETNMLEEKPLSIDLKDNAVALYFRPFEIKTIRCIPAGSQ